MAAAGVLGAGSIAAVAGGASATAATVVVAPWGNDAAAGSAGAPLRTIGRAVAVASSGATITLLAGRYHESVQVYSKALHIEAAPGQAVVLDGTRAVDGWAGSGGAWSSGGWTYEPPVLTDVPVDPAHPDAGYADQVFVDGTPLRQVLSRGEVAPGTFFHDRAGDRLWLGSDPAGHVVEASDLPFALYLNHADGSSVKGISVRGYGTPSTAMGAVRAYGNDITLDGLTVADNAYAGISVIGQRVTVSGVVVRRNGYIGVHAHLSAQLTVRDSLIIANNAAGFDSLHSAAGMKITTTTDLVIRHNRVADNDGPGVWTDISAARITVAGNLIEDNARSGVELELSGHAIVIDNVVRSNGEVGVWVLESNDVKVWNNAMSANEREVWVEDGPRTSPSATPEAQWDLQRVEVANNVLGPGNGTQALFNVDDWTQVRSAVDMQVTANTNAYWRSGAVGRTSRVARWPAPLAINATLTDHRAATGFDADGAESTATQDPFRRSTGDWRMPTGGPGGQALPADVAAAIGRSGGSPVAIGPVSADQPGLVPPAAVPDAELGYVAVEPAAVGNGSVVVDRTPGVAAADAGRTMRFTVAGVAGIPRDAEGVVFNMTARRPQANGYAVVHDCGVAMPPTSNLNFRTGVAVTNLAIAAPAANGTVCVSTRGVADIDIDVLGYFPAGSNYGSVTPTRVSDTRQTGSGQLGAGSTMRVAVAGGGGIPGAAEAVVLNLTATRATQPGYLTVYPCSQTRPKASTLNYRAGSSVANLALAVPGADGQVCIYSSAAADVIVDVAGWVGRSRAYTPLLPARLLDTRAGQSTVDGQFDGIGAWPAGSTFTLKVAGRGGVAASAETAMVNVTAIGSAGRGAVTVFPCGAPRPLRPSVHVADANPVANAVVVPVGEDGSVCLYTESEIQFVVDVVGYGYSTA